MAMIPNLDDFEEIRAIDREGMIDLVLDFPEQCERAVGIADTFQPTNGFKSPKQIVVSGLGSSAIAGDMVGALLKTQVSIPIITNRDYHLPPSVDSSALVVVISYSGNTEETLSAYREAQTSGAMLYCITSGGLLGEAARQDGVDILHLPNGMPARAALGYIFISLLLSLEKLGITSGWKDLLPENIDMLRKLRDQYNPSVEQDDNQAKELARDMYLRIPVIYAASGVPSAAATRWKDQINLNSKMHAFTNIFPELSHNEIDGWEMANLQSESFAAVIIRDPESKSRVVDKIELTKTLIPKGFPIHDVPLEGHNALEKLLRGVYLGDFVSVYLAVLNRSNPSVTTGVEAIKEETAGKLHQ